MRIGYGWDSHEFKKGVPLKIGGVALEHTHGLAGHSDGDVLLHALTDALLGAVAAGDIGGYFPPSDPKWKNADSSLFVSVALAKVKEAGYQVCNVDSTLVLSEPRVGPVANRIRQRVAELLEKQDDHKKLEVAAAMLDADKHVDEVVKGLISDVKIEKRPRREKVRT